LRTVLTEAESLERLVVRTADLVPGPGPFPEGPAKIDPIGGGGGGKIDPFPQGVQLNERHLLPPKTTLALAEQHRNPNGAFAPTSDPRWYAVACKEKGTLEDTSIIDASHELTPAGVPYERAIADLGDPIVLCNPPSSLAPPPSFPPKGLPLAA